MSNKKLTAAEIKAMTDLIKEINKMHEISERQTKDLLAVIKEGQERRANKLKPWWDFWS